MKYSNKNISTNCLPEELTYPTLNAPLADGLTITGFCKPRSCMKFAKNWCLD